MNFIEEFEKAEMNYNKAIKEFIDACSKLDNIKKDLKEYSIFFCKYPDHNVLLDRLLKFLNASEQVRIKEFEYHLSIYYYNFYACELNYYVLNYDKKKFIPILCQPVFIQIKQYTNKLILPKWNKISNVQKSKDTAISVLKEIITILEKIRYNVHVKMEYTNITKTEHYVNMTKLHLERHSINHPHIDYAIRVLFLMFNRSSKCLLYWATEEFILNAIINNINYIITN